MPMDLGPGVYAVFEHGAVQVLIIKLWLSRTRSHSYLLSGRRLQVSSVQRLQNEL